MKLKDQFKNIIKIVINLFYGTVIKKKKKIDEWINAKKGSGGTSPDNIAKFANTCESHREHLIIVTDGEVGETSIKQNDTLMNQFNIHFQFVSIYVVGTGGNLSVGAPFCRGWPNRTIHILSASKRINGPTLSLEEIDAFNSISKINSIDEFDKKYDKLSKAINAKQLGKNRDKDMEQKLRALNIRIIKTVKDPKKTDFEQKWEKLFEMDNNKGVHYFKIGTGGINKK